ncbi:MAG: peptidylprolyl isomerase [Caulobacteraceae bacterium]
MLKRRDFLVASAWTAAWPAFSQSAVGSVKVALQTGRGLIVLELRPDKAPLTAANFLRYVDTHRFDSSSFYRASRAPGAPTVGLIEGGLQNDLSKLLPPVAHESTLTTGLRHEDGTVSMARDAPGSATADFFICSGPAAYLDARPGAPGDNAGYAAFGQVVQGMEVVRTILELPTTGVARNPMMQGQILDPTVPILSAKRT